MLWEEMNKRQPTSIVNLQNYIEDLKHMNASLRDSEYLLRTMI